MISSILLKRGCHESPHLSPTYFPRYRLRLAPAFFAGGTRCPEWINPCHAAAFLVEIGPCTWHPCRWNPSTHDRRATGFPIQRFPEQSCRLELLSLAVRNSERRHRLVARRIRTRKHDDRRRSWNCRDWSCRLHRPYRLAVRAAKPDSINRPLLALSRFTHFLARWISHQRRHGFPVRSAILCPCAASSSTSDFVGFCRHGHDRRHPSSLADCLERRTLQFETRSLRDGCASRRLRRFDRRIHHFVAPPRTRDRRTAHPQHRSLRVQS